MNKRNVFALLLILLVVLIAAGIGLAQGEQELTYTGCLNNGGEIKNVAVGDRPLKACGVNETQISWNQTGPQGSAGLYLSSLVGSTKIEECVMTEDEVHCEKKLSFTVEVNEADPVNLTINDGELTLYAEKIMPPIKDHCQSEVHRSGAYLICINIETKGKVFQLGLSPALPLNRIDGLITCRLFKDSMVNCSLNGDRIRQNIIENKFEITRADIAPYPAGARETQLILTVANKKGPRANAVISAPVCKFPLEPMAAQSVVLEEGEVAKISFELRTDGPLVEGQECHVSLVYPTGTIYDDAVVKIPPPEEN